jgi:hypothetical protein
MPENYILYRIKQRDAPKAVLTLVFVIRVKSKAGGEDGH